MWWGEVVFVLVVGLVVGFVIGRSERW